MKTLNPYSPDLSPTEAHWAYNALDCEVTREVAAVLHHQLHSPGREADLQVYRFEKALMGPVLEMGLRGLKVDAGTRAALRKRYYRESMALFELLNQIGTAVMGEPKAPCKCHTKTVKCLQHPGLNPSSPTMLVRFFYDYLRLKKVWKSDKGKRKLSTDRDTLEKLAEQTWEAEWVVKIILQARDKRKLVQVLDTAIDPDGRIRTSYNIGGTETGRFSSNKNPEGTGTNLQNITDYLRRMYVADPGKLFAYIDLEQAESRAVGYISGDLSYIEACESGDLHTTVCRMVWPELGWTGDTATDRAKADETLFYRHFSYRDIAKRLGHATNYYGTAWQLSRILKIPQKLVVDFQRKYFAAFPGIARWHSSIQRTLLADARLTSCFGRTRQFFGRPEDKSTLRKAIAHEPQSTVGDYLNAGMLGIWSNVPQVQLMAQLHDAVLVQGPENEWEEWLPLCRAQMEFETYYDVGKMIIPTDAELGWNWAHATNDNLDGLTKVTKHAGRTRTPVLSDAQRLLSQRAG